MSVFSQKMPEMNGSLCVCVCVSMCVCVCMCACVCVCEKGGVALLGRMRKYEG